MLSIFRMSKGVIKRCDFHRRRMLWKDKQWVKKYHPVRWPDLCQPTDLGGLYVTNLELKILAFSPNDFGVWRMEVVFGRILLRLNI